MGRGEGKKGRKERWRVHRGTDFVAISGLFSTDQTPQQPVIHLSPRCRSGATPGVSCFLSPRCQA